MTGLRRILVATDFSPSGHAAVARAGQLAKHYGSLLAVYHATPDWTMFSQRANARQEHYAEITRNADTLMRSELGWLSQEYGLTGVRGEVYRGRATLAVASAIEAFEPNLVVIGAGGEHALPDGAAVLGGTALKLISRIALPLLLVRNPVPTDYQSALVAVGGEFNSAQRLLQWAVTLADFGTCYVVRAYDAPYEVRMRLCGVDNAAIAEATAQQRLLARQDCEALTKSVQCATNFSIQVERGAPLSTVLAQVVNHAPQLLVVGQHPHHADEYPGAWAAGLGTRLAYHCPTDVLMVP